MVEQSQTQKKAFDGKTEVLRFSEPVKVGSNQYFVSLQRVVNSAGVAGNPSLVIKKQAIGDDGSSRGLQKQIWIPETEVKKVLEHALDWLSKQKK